MVELREVSDTSRNPTSGDATSEEGERLVDEELLSPESAWRAYLADAKSRGEFVDSDDDELLDKFLRIGLKILEEIEIDEPAGAESGQPSSHFCRHYNRPHHYYHHHQS